ncbi:hypothetical protein D5S18_30205 [Nocardia panacis]|uniref:Uncharacterized protein n=1 Tax=Nocardia panacis TaxID=2340916 RepID=A0A3A4K6P7_9NOCA|nr:hypothetical protein D5S18_30205 [Nocardia panacis]
MIVGLIVAGCSSGVAGSAASNPADLLAYRRDASATSQAVTSSKKRAAQAKAIDENCSQFPTTSGVGVAKYNEFVDAHDANAADYLPKRDLAAATLTEAATKVESGVDAAGDRLPTDLTAKLREYVAAARDLAAETRRMTYTASVDPLNIASRRVNDARNAVRETCPAR